MTFSFLRWIKLEKKAWVCWETLKDHQAIDKKILSTHALFYTKFREKRSFFTTIQLKFTALKLYQELEHKSFHKNMQYFIHWQQAAPWCSHFFVQGSGHRMNLELFAQTKFCQML